MINYKYPKDYPAWKYINEARAVPHEKLIIMEVVPGKINLQFYMNTAAAFQKRGHQIIYITNSDKVNRDLLDNKIAAINLSNFIENIKIDPQTDQRKFLFEEYGIASANKIYFSQNIKKSYKKHNYRSYQVLLYLLGMRIIIENINPDFAVIRRGGEIFKKAIFLNCRKRNIPCLIIGACPLNKNRSNITDYDLQEIDPFVYKSELDKSTTTTCQEIIDEITKNKDIPIEKPKGLINKIRVLFKQLGYSNADNFWEVSRYFLKKSRERLRAFIINLLYYPSLKKSLAAINSHRFIYLPLAFKDEWRMIARNPQFYYQEFLVHLIAMNLPTGYKLMIKEHPDRLGNISIASIKAMRRYPDVLFLNPRLSGKKVMQKCDLLAVINNTSGLEAMLENKPVIVFGDGFYKYDGLTIGLEKYSDISNLDQILTKAINFRPDQKKLLALCQHINNEAYLFNYRDFIPADADKMVDNILRYIHSTHK